MHLHRSLRMAPWAAALVVTAGLATNPLDAAGEKRVDFGTQTGITPGHPGVLGVSAAFAINNAQVCVAPNDQTAPFFLPDGNGGGIAVWSDGRDGNYDIYAQRLDASGTPAWVAGGVPVCKASGHQIEPKLIADGAGGVIVVWEDARDPLDPNIYAQRVSASGVMLWTSDGIVVCAAAAEQTKPIATSDGQGGAIVAWLDNRGVSLDLYAQRLNGAGAAQWTAGGALVCGAVGTQDSPTMVSDGLGGAIVAWRDVRTGGPDIFAQRMTFAGSAAWAANGVAVCEAASGEVGPQATSDGAGGVIVGWADSRGADFDIYAQRLNGAGAAQWAVNGVAVSAAAGLQERVTICTDGSSGAVLAWEDRRAGNADVYAQRVSSAGAALWTAGGVAVGNAANDQLTPNVAADPTGAALVVWSDGRTPANSADVYAQRLTLAAGAASWTAGGSLVCDTTGSQVAPSVVSDGVGGALVAWRDYRGGAVPDLYGQRLDSGGAVPSQCAAVVALAENTPVSATASNVYYNYLQDMFFWAGVGVRPSSGTDWDIEIYEDGTFNTAAYPICFSHSFAGSYSTSGVDFVVGNHNDGYTPIGSYGVRATRYSGATAGTVEWDGAAQSVTKDCTGGSCGARSGNNWTGVIDVWDVYLIAGEDYVFDFTRTGSGDIRFLFFSPGSGTGTTFLPRSGREFETTARYTGYRATVTGWHGMVFVNDNGVAGTYIGKVFTGAVTGVGDEAGSITGLRGVVPNPARGAVRIQFALQQPGDVSMRILDMAGRAVGEIAPHRWNAGNWSIQWDGSGKSGRQLAAGMYFVEMSVNGQRVGRSRLALLR